MTAIANFARRWAIFVGLVVVWEVAARIAASPYFPPPSAIVRQMHALWFSGAANRLFLTSTATENLLPSFSRMTVGLAAAIVAGVVLGIGLGRSDRVFAYLDPVFQFARAIPPPTMVPVLVVIFKLGTQMQVVAIIIGTIWPILLNTTDGARSVDRLQMATAQVFKLSAVTRIRRIILPSTLPNIFVGLRLGLSLALVQMVFSELLPGTTDGIGFELTDAQSRSDVPTMWSAIILLGIIGYVLNIALLIVERRMLRWHHASRATRTP